MAYTPHHSQSRCKVPLYIPTQLSDTHIRGRLRRGIFAGVDMELAYHGGLAPWYLSSPATRKAAWEMSLIDVMDALCEMDLRHDIPIMAFVGPIETYTSDDDNPSNASIFTYLSRPIQQSKNSGTKQIVARAREDFLNGIVRPHSKFRGHRQQFYKDHKDAYCKSVSSNGGIQDGGPWDPNADTYTQLLDSMAIGGVPLDEINPLALPPITGIQPEEFRSIRGSMYTPPSLLPPSQQPSLAAASPRAQHSQEDPLYHRLSSLSLHEPAVIARMGSGESAFEPTEWGVRKVPAHYRICPSLDFILAAHSVGDAQLAMVKCIVGDERCTGHELLEKLEGILGFGLARTVAYLMDRLDSSM